MKRYTLRPQADPSDIFAQADTLEEIEQLDKNWTNFSGEKMPLDLYDWGEFSGISY